jgi:hypothetical protein
MGMLFRIILLTSIVWSSASFAFAGTSDGGGGTGVRCPADVSPIAIELLDLHEVKLKGEQIAFQPTSLDEAIDLSATKLGNHYYVPSKVSSAPYIGYLKRNIVEKIFRGQPFTNPINGMPTKIEFVDDLPLADDIGTYSIKPGCSIEQVAYYFDNINTLKIVTSRWNELSWVDRSALVAHEIHYFLDRHNAIEDFDSQVKKTSERARNFVGMLYSQTGVTPKYASTPVANKFTCATNVNSEHRNTWFTVFSTGANEFSAVFESVQGYSSVYSTKAVFANNGLDSIMNWFDGEMNSSVELKIYTPESLLSFSIRITKAKYQNPRFQAFIEKSGEKKPFATEEEIICWDPEN